jgi:Tfp pilus assembly protein PilP
MITLLLSALLTSMPGAGQTPMPVAAINAAKGARADVEAADRKNSDALNTPAVPPQTQAHPAPAAVPAGASAVSPSGAAPVPAPQNDGAYTYDGQGRRDPFVSLVNRGDSMHPSNAPRPAGLQGLMINEIVVKGILKTPNGLVAIVQGSDNRTYIVHAGERVLDGSIKSIAQDAIVFAQDVNDPLSTVKQRELRKTIRTEVR